MKTLAIRLEDNLHMQLAVLAKLEGINITDAIRSAIENYIARYNTSPELKAKAKEMLDQIDREFLEHKRTLTLLLGGSEEAEPEESADGSSARGRRKPTE